ncbi:Iron transport multicopper oxidase FET3 [Diplodia seriata]|uniref:Iron transport multicopper oxidase FET3 n=1 Tax=Diplodia seriata TaxID=420778 RepID=A0A1S8B5Z5_9PEZI|nr:Iron transport multicopper oxidase FET3 [Diplodia seriata]
MARSLFLLLAAALCTNAATVTHDFNVTWVTANPDGAYRRSTIGINGQWPPPAIDVTKGDRVIVNVNNQLETESTSLHFHGIYMNGSNHMDGPTGVTQCEIPPGSSFTYNFTVDQPGTYWYHSHNRGQYPDGLRGPFIVRDPDSPFKDDYDEEVVLTFSDWYHDRMPTLLKSFISVTNPTGAEPVPNAALMNDTQDLIFHMIPGKRYMFRLLNIGAFAAQYVWFEGHTMSVVEVDGIYTEPAEAERLYITAAQRYSVIISAKNETNSNYAFVGSMDEDLFDTVPSTLNNNVTGWLVYDDRNANLPPLQIDDYDAFDDFSLVPQDGLALYDHVDHSITLDMKMDNLEDGANYAFFNDVTYVEPKVPTLYTVLSTGDNATDPVIYGSNTNAFILDKDVVVEIVLNNNDPGKHPFHLHGHAFQAVVRSQEEAGSYVGNETFPSKPMRRDTILVRPNGNIVLRFKADNPGVWLFHCHIEWHVASGLIATMISAPLDLQSSLSNNIPADHWRACSAAGTPTAGNAAGNTVDYLDLSGENKSPGPIHSGFTARGIVALVFSCISAVLGMAAIAWYGMAPLMSPSERRQQQQQQQQQQQGQEQQQQQQQQQQQGRSVQVGIMPPAVAAKRQRRQLSRSDLEAEMLGENDKVTMVEQRRTSRGSSNMLDPTRRASPGMGQMLDSRTGSRAGSGHVLHSRSGSRGSSTMLEISRRNSRGSEMMLS